MKKCFFEFFMFLMIFSSTAILSGCGEGIIAEDIVKENYINDVKERSELDSLPFETILVYCQPSVYKPIMEIKKIFEEETNCEVQINVANTSDIEEEIKNSKQGEIFISETNDLKKSFNSLISEQKYFAIHSAVLAVKKGAFEGVTTLEKIMKENPVFINYYDNYGKGKIAKDFFKLYSNKYNFVFDDFVDEDEVYNELANNENENCATIGFKEYENENVDFIELEEVKAIHSFVTVNSLKTSENQSATIEFISFNNSDEAKKIWENYGFKVI